MQAQALAERVQQVTAESVEIACVDERTTCEKAAEAAEHGIELQVLKVPEVKRGFALSPRCWVGERSSEWARCFRRLTRDYKRLAETLAELHFLAFTVLMLTCLVNLITGGA